MVERTEVYVKNLLSEQRVKDACTDETLKDTVTNKITIHLLFAGGGTGNPTPITGGKTEGLHLPDAETAVVIQLPDKVDPLTFPFKITSPIDLSVTYSRTHFNWTIRTIESKLPAHVPLHVNVELGEVEPG